MARIALPKTPQTKRWVRCTDDLRIEMRSRLDKLKVQLTAMESEIAQLEGALALFDQLLPPAEPRLKAVPERWSPMYPACTRCARTDRPHQARGLCATCYQHDVRQAREAS